MFVASISFAFLFLSSTARKPTNSMCYAVNCIARTTYYPVSTPFMSTFCTMPTTNSSLYSLIITTFMSASLLLCPVFCAGSFFQCNIGTPLMFASLYFGPMFNTNSSLLSVVGTSLMATSLPWCNFCTMTFTNSSLLSLISTTFSGTNIPFLLSTMFDTHSSFLSIFGASLSRAFETNTLLLRGFIQLPLLTHSIWRLLFDVLFCDVRCCFGRRQLCPRRIVPIAVIFVVILFTNCLYYGRLLCCFEVVWHLAAAFWREIVRWGGNGGR